MSEQAPKFRGLSRIQATSRAQCGTHVTPSYFQQGSGRYIPTEGNHLSPTNSIALSSLSIGNPRFIERL